MSRKASAMTMPLASGRRKTSVNPTRCTTKSARSVSTSGFTGCRPWRATEDLGGLGGAPLLRRGSSGPIGCQGSGGVSAEAWASPLLFFRGRREAVHLERATQTDGERHPGAGCDEADRLPALDQRVARVAHAVDRLAEPDLRDVRARRLRLGAIPLLDLETEGGLRQHSIELLVSLGEHLVV